MHSENFCEIHGKNPAMKSFSQTSLVQLYFTEHLQVVTYDIAKATWSI